MSKKVKNQQPILNEVEMKKEQRLNERITHMKKMGLKDDQIKTELANDDKKLKKDVVVCNTVTDIQKRKIDKLMSDTSREVYIPEPRKEWKPRDPAEFVRHVMGSSAGAGSGEFHVYRGIRRRETKRTEFLERKGIKEELDKKFHETVNENKAKADKVTEKKRLKRQKRKQKKLMSKKLKSINISNQSSGSEKEEIENNFEMQEEIEEEKQHFVIGGK